MSSYYLMDMESRQIKIINGAIKGSTIWGRNMETLFMNLMALFKKENSKMISQ